MSSHPNDSRPDSVNLKDDPAQDGGVSRRRLLRAGLAASPVAAVFHSSPVLATGRTCVRPSSYASLHRENAVLEISKHRAMPDRFNCRPASSWIGSSKASRNVNADELNPKLANVGKTFEHYLSSYPSETEGTKRLRKVLCAYYLTAEALSDHGVLLTRQECQTAWTNGKWGPFTTAADTAQYLEVMANGITIVER